jgi:hypothetical protein
MRRARVRSIGNRNRQGDPMRSFLPLMLVLAAACSRSDAAQTPSPTATAPIAPAATPAPAPVAPAPVAPAPVAPAPEPEVAPAPEAAAGDDQDPTYTLTDRAGDVADAIAEHGKVDGHVGTDAKVTVLHEVETLDTDSKPRSLRGLAAVNAWLGTIHDPTRLPAVTCAKRCCTFDEPRYEEDPTLAAMTNQIKTLCFDAGNNLTKIHVLNIGS